MHYLGALSMKIATLPVQSKYSVRMR